MPPGDSQAVVLVTLWYSWYAAHLHYVELPNFISSGETVQTRQITVETFFIIILFFLLLLLLLLFVVYFCFLLLLMFTLQIRVSIINNRMANSVDPDETAVKGLVYAIYCLH